MLHHTSINSIVLYLLSKLNACTHTHTIVDNKKHMCKLFMGVCFCFFYYFSYAYITIVLFLSPYTITHVLSFELLPKYKNKLYYTPKI